MEITEIACPRPTMLMDSSGSYYYPDDTPLARYQVFSDSGARYVVTNVANDETLHDGMFITLECTCPAGQHHRPCKHAKAVHEWLTADA